LYIFNFIKKSLGSKKTSAKAKLNDSNEINRLLLRCQTDLKQLIKKLGNESQVKNINNVFTNKMLGEMLRILPQTREDLLGITGYTDAIFEKYGGDKFLQIFCHYASLKKNLEAEERVLLKKKQEEFAKQKAGVTMAGLKQSKTYGLLNDDDFDDEENDDDISIAKSMNYDFSS
jgi:NACalpha-BTF3-like transcription factor